MWRAENILPNLGYPHDTVNHSREFVSPTGVHTQGGKGRMPGVEVLLRNVYTNGLSGTTLPETSLSAGSL